MYVRLTRLPPYLGCTCRLLPPSNLRLFTRNYGLATGTAWIVSRVCRTHGAGVDFAAAGCADAGLVGKEIDFLGVERLLCKAGNIEIEYDLWRRISRCVQVSSRLTSELPKSL